MKDETPTKFNRAEQMTAYDISAILFIIGFALLIYVMSATKDPQ